MGGYNFIRKELEENGDRAGIIMERGEGLVNIEKVLEEHREGPAQRGEELGVYGEELGER